MNNISIKYFAQMSLLLMLSVAVLSGCGFQLRGATELAPIFDVTHIRGADDSEIKTRLVRSLETSGVTVSPGFKGATAVLTIMNVDEDKRALSERSGEVAEYELRYSVTFALQNASAETVLESQTVNAIRVYSYDPDDVLGRGFEEAEIRKDLRNNVVQQIMRRLSAVK